jgi:hypothetical protein
MAWLTFAIAAVLIGGFAVLAWQGTRERKTVEAEFRRLEALPEVEARSFALELLRRPGLFILKPAVGGLETALPLPASISELLGQYEEVVRGEFWVGRTALSQAPRVRGFTKIGEDFEFEEILVRAEDERVYSLYGDAPAQEPLESVRSIWHKIINVSGAAPGTVANGV